MALPPHRVDYLPIIDRPTIKWPNGARVALWICPNIEIYEYLPTYDGMRNPYPRSPYPDVQQYSWRDYGNRIGFWRLLEVFDKHHIRCGVSLNLAVLEHFPEIRDAMVERNWDFMCHGIYNTRYLNDTPEEEEREFYRDCIQTLKKHTGKQLKGNIGPAISATERTPDLMAEAGLIYHAHWIHDDQPVPIKVKSGKLVSVPYSSPGTGDGRMEATGTEGEHFFQACKDQFNQLYKEGAENGRVMCIGLHPFVSGQPHRVKYLDKLFGYIMSHDGVWQTTADEIAEYYIARYYEEAIAHADRLKRFFVRNEDSIS
jgi:allantoinase